jgi:protein-disulfide isomerase
MQKINVKQITGTILIVGILITGAILLKGKTASVATQQADNNAKTDLGAIKIRPIFQEEHVWGNRNARVVILEYSDTECPFCKIFHNTMHQVMKQRGEKVAWVYKHYPITQLHSKSFHEAVAVECAAVQGGNEAFWKYIDEVYTRTESNNKLDPAELPKIAKDISLDLVSFNDCLINEKTKEEVQADIDSGNRIRVNGTPTSFILKNGKVVDTIGGALPLESVLQKIDNALK